MLLLLVCCAHGEGRVIPGGASEEKRMVIFEEAMSIHDSEDTQVAILRGIRHAVKEATTLVEIAEETKLFRLPAVPLGHVHSEIITDVAQVVEKRTLVDDIIKQAMQKAEAEATPDWSVDKVIPTDHGVTNKAETRNNHLGISLIQLDPAQELEESIHKTPKSFKLPSLPVGDVQYKVDGQLPKVVAEEKLVAAEERGLEMLSDNGIENDANLTKLMSARDHVAAALLKATTELRNGVVPKLLL